MLRSGLADRLRGALRQVRALIRKDAVEREMAEEMRFHLEMEMEQHVRNGLTPEVARREAVKAFGGVEQHKLGVREERWTRVFEDLAMDVRFALRSLRRNPALLFTAMITLGLGIGATTVVFTLTRAVLYPELSIARLDEVITVNERRMGRVSSTGGLTLLPSKRVLEYGEAASGVLSGVAGYTFDTFSLRSDEGARSITGTLTVGNYFEVLGIRPVIGRFYTSDDEAAVVLGYDLWRSVFGTDRDVIGRTVHIDSRPFQVIGVAPRGFGGTWSGIASEAWYPVRAYGAAGKVNEDAAPWLIPIGRLAPGVSLDAAGSMIDDIARRIPPGEAHTTVSGARVEPVTGIPLKMRGPVAGFFAMLMGTAGFVLMIASANIAGLLLARSLARRREIALRLALGAARTRLVRQLMTEVLILFVAGAGAGMLATIIATRLLQRISLPIPVRISLDLSPDLWVFAFGFLIAAVAGLIFGLAPALIASRTDLLTMIKDDGAGSGGRRGRIRSVFVGAQLALAIVLLVVTGLFVRTLQNSLQRELGFDPNDVVVATFNLDRHGYTEERGRAFQQRVLEEIRALPGIDAAGLSHTTLLSGSEQASEANSVDQSETGAARAAILFANVDAGYFETLRIPILAGRALTDKDRETDSPPAVINQRMASEFWPDEAAIGKRFRITNVTYEVVGIARDGVYANPDETHRSFVFLPSTHTYNGTMTLNVRTTAPPAQTLVRIRRIIAELDPDIALETARPLPAVIGFTLFPQRFAAVLIGTFGIAGLLLGAIGVYGVMASYVAQRYREFGIRVALGAHPRAVAMLVMKRGVVLAFVGGTIGMALAALVAGLLHSFVFNVKTLDPLTFSAAALILCIAVLAASYLPARRAADLDPLAAINSR